MTQLEVEQQRPAEADTIKHLGKNVHASDVSPADGKTQCLDDRALSSEMSLP
jgi:hypothetical protein